MMACRVQAVLLFTVADDPCTPNGDRARVLCLMYPDGFRGGRKSVYCSGLISGGAGGALTGKMMYRKYSGAFCQLFT